MPLEPTKFNSAEEVNTFILNLRKEKIFTEGKLAYEFIVATDGNTYRVSEILELSDEAAEKYDIKFLVRKKEQPENDEDFAECSLKEFRNSQNKKLFVYNKMLVDALLAIHQQRPTVNGRKVFYQRSIIDPDQIETPCPLTKQRIIVPFITYSNTYEATAIIKYFKTNIDKGIKTIDPITLGYFPLNKIVPNKALTSLIIINHKNFINNKCAYFLKIIGKQPENNQTTIQEAKEKITKHLEDIKSSIEISKNLETDLPKNQVILNESREALPKKYEELKNSEATIKKYSPADLTNYNQLKTDISIVNQTNRTLRNRLRIGYVLVIILCALLVISDIIFTVTRVVAPEIILAGGLFGIAALSVGACVRYAYHNKKSNIYQQIITETNGLLANIDELIKLQKTIEFTERYQKLCESTLQFINHMDLLKILENAIPPELFSTVENQAKTPSPSDTKLSSSEYLLKTGGKKFSKEDKQEKDEKKKSKSGEVILNINEELNERSPLLNK